MKLIPKVGIALTGIEGVDLDQDRLKEYQEKFKKELKGFNTDNVLLNFTVNNEKSSKKANSIFKKEDIDVILLVVAQWTSDKTALEIIQNLEIPVIIFTTNVSPHAISINGAQNIAASLKELDIPFRFIFGDIKNVKTRKKIINYATAAAVVKKLKITRIASIGNIPEIMLSLSTDPLTVKKIFGCNVITIDYYKMENYRSSIKKDLLEKRITEIKKEVGKIRVDDNALAESISFYYGLKKMADELNLDAIALNCYPYPALKGKTCLAASNLNDDGIITSCEGDINASIIMMILDYINGKAVLNSDLIIDNKSNNTIMFSHCGSGPFTCASDIKDIMLQENYEVKSGVGVYYPVTKNGEEITIVNLVGREPTYRMCILKGKSVSVSEMTYCGNLVNVKFNTDVEELINTIGNEGFGHHWMVSYGDHGNIFKEIGNLLGINHMFID